MTFQSRSEPSLRRLARGQGGGDAESHPDDGVAQDTFINIVLLILPVIASVVIGFGG